MSMPKLQLCLLLAVLGATAASTPATGVTQFMITFYSAAGCADADAVENDYKAIGACREDDGAWYKAKMVDGDWVSEAFTDSACTQGATADETINGACTGPTDDGQWYKGSEDKTVVTLYVENYNTSSCVGDPLDNFYHGAHNCEPVDPGDDKGVSMIREIDGETFTEKHYSQAACAGGLNSSLTVEVVADGTCQAHPSESGIFLKMFLWRESGLPGAAPATSAPGNGSNSSTTAASPSAATSGGSGMSLAAAQALTLVSVAIAALLA